MIRIREARESLNMSQEQFAEMLGYSQKSVSNWESGIREPKYSILIQIADICGLSTDYLLGRTDIKSCSTEKSPTPEELATDLKIGGNAITSGNSREEYPEGVTPEMVRYFEQLLQKYLAEHSELNH